LGLVYLQGLYAKIVSECLYRRSCDDGDDQPSPK
jgi:hypothetical protein